MASQANHKLITMTRAVVVAALLALLGGVVWAAGPGPQTRSSVTLIPSLPEHLVKAELARTTGAPGSSE